MDYSGNCIGDIIPSTLNLYSWSTGNCSCSQEFGWTSTWTETVALVPPESLIFKDTAYIQGFSRRLAFH